MGFPFGFFDGKKSAHISAMNGEKAQAQAQAHAIEAISLRFHYKY